MALSPYIGQNRQKDWPRETRRRTGLEVLSLVSLFPPTRVSELMKNMQSIEKDMTPGGCKNWPIKIIETSGKTLGECFSKSRPLFGKQMC